MYPLTHFQEDTDSPPVPSSLNVSPNSTMVKQRSLPHSQVIQSESRKESATQGIMGDSSANDELDNFEDTSRPISELSSSVSNSRLKDFESRPVSNVSGSRPDSLITMSSRPGSQSTYSKPCKRPSSSIIEALEIESELFSYGLDQCQRDSLEQRGSPDIDIDYQVSGNASDDSMNMNDIDFDPLYQEVDQNHESTYEPKKCGPPQIRIERKIFHERMDSFVSSSNDSEDMLERLQRAPIYATIEKPTMPVEPMSRRSVEFEPAARCSGFYLSDDTIISPMHSSPVTLTPRSPLSPLSPITPQLPDLVSTPSMQQHHQHLSSSSANTISTLVTLPCRPPRDRIKPPPVHFDFEDSVISRLDHPSRTDSHVVSAEVHSAPATVSRQGSKSKQPTQLSRARFNTWVSTA